MLAKTPPETVHSVAADQLKSIVERVERLHEEREALGSDIKEVYAEAKANGYDVRALKAVIARRRLDPSERQERDAIEQIYRDALGVP